MSDSGSFESGQEQPSNSVARAGTIDFDASNKKLKARAFFSDVQQKAFDIYHDYVVKEKAKIVGRTSGSNSSR